MKSLLPFLTVAATSYGSGKALQQRKISLRPSIQQCIKKYTTADGTTHLAITINPDSIISINLFRKRSHLAPLHARFVGIENIPLDKTLLEKVFRILPGRIVRGELSPCGHFATITTTSQCDDQTPDQKQITYILETEPIFRDETFKAFISSPHATARELAVYCKDDDPTSLSGRFAISTGTNEQARALLVQTKPVNDIWCQAITNLFCPNWSNTLQEVISPSIVLPGTVTNNQK